MAGFYAWVSLNPKALAKTAGYMDSIRKGAIKVQPHLRY